MSIDHEDPFHDIGYTSPEQVDDLRAMQAKTAAGALVQRTVRDSHRYSRPRVGEEGKFSNVDNEPTLLSAEEREHLESVVWAEREQNILASLEADRYQARLHEDMQGAARLRAKIDQREKRWNGMGRGALQLMLPGMDSGHLQRKDT